MNHAEHDESIGSMLASIAAALREVSDKLDIVAARVQLDVPTFPVDEDVPDHTRIRRLESWAFRASQDISRLSSRLDALDNGGETDSGPARGTRSRREVREAAEAAERAVDGLDDHLPAPEPLPAHQHRDADSLRPPLERRNSPTRPTTDHLGDPTALAATPIPRTVPTEAAAPFGQPISFDSDSFAAVGGDDASSEPPSRRPAPARLSGAAASGERVGASASTNGIAATNGSANGIAGDIASPRNGASVPAVIGTVVTASAVDHTSGTATKTLAATHSDDRVPAVEGTASATDTATTAALPGSAEVSTAVRASESTIRGVNGVGLGSDATKQVEAQPARPTADTEDPQTAGISSDAVIERARPVKKPAESSGTGGRLSTPAPDALSSNGNGADPAVNAQPAGNSANGIHWSFSDEPAPTSTTPDRNGHARNGFTTDSARRSDSLFDDFTPRDRLTTGETPEPPTVSGPPARLTPPTELTTQPNHLPADATRTAGSAHVNGSSEGPAYPSLSSTDRPANTGRLPDPSSLTDHAPLTNNPGLTNHERPADFDPPTLGLPTGRETPTNPDPLERPVADPIPPTATDAAGITVTGTYRAFDIERAHVDKLQAMLDELKRSAGLPPGRRDVFGPPTPELG